jgi:glycosyltransferase involved in cell wall biosynthesis
MLSVIVPALNEVRRLPATLQALRVYLDGAGEEYEEYEVIVVDDGSHDGTAQLAEQAAAGWMQLQVIRLPQNLGKGAAVRAGMLAARGGLRLFTDADLSTPISELAKLRDLIEGTTAVAIGSRAVPDSEVEVHQPFGREVMGRTYNRILRLQALHGGGRRRLLHPAPDARVRFRRRGAAPGPAPRLARCRGRRGVAARGELPGQPDPRLAGHPGRSRPVATASRLTRLSRRCHLGCPAAGTGNPFEGVVQRAPGGGC